MKFPDDFTKGEPMCNALAIYFKELIVQIQLAEDAKIFKARDPSTVLPTFQLLTSLFESSDFEVFDMMVKVGFSHKTYFLRLPMTRIQQDSSAATIGEAIVILLRQSETSHSYLKNYRKKFASILAKYADLLSRSIINMHSLHVETTPLVSNRLRVGKANQVKRRIRLEQVQLVQLATFMITWDIQYKLGVYKFISESALDVLTTWFIDCQ